MATEQTTLPYLTEPVYAPMRAVVLARHPFFRRSDDRPEFLPGISLAGQGRLDLETRNFIAVLKNCSQLAEPTIVRKCPKGSHKFNAQELRFHAGRAVLTAIHQERDANLVSVTDSDEKMTVDGIVTSRLQEIGAMIIMDRALQEQEKITRPTPDEPSVVLDLIQLRRLVYVGGIRMKIGGISLVDLLGISSLSPVSQKLVGVKFFVESLITRAKQDHQRWVPDNSLKIGWSTFPTLTEESLKDATGYASTLASSVPDRISATLVSGLSKERAEAALVARRLVERVSLLPSWFQDRLINPTDPNFSLYKEFFMPYLTQDKHTRVFALNALKTQLDSRRFIQLYRRVCTFIAQGTEVDFYKKLKQGFEDIISMMAPSTGLYTQEELPLLTRSDKDKITPRGEDIYEMVKTAYRKPGERSMKIDGSNCPWQTLPPASEVEVVFEAGKAQFEVIYRFADNELHHARVNFSVSPAIPNFDWDCLVVPDELPEARDRFLRQALLIAQAFSEKYPAREAEPITSQLPTSNGNVVPRRSDVVKEARAARGNESLPKGNGAIKESNGSRPSYTVPKASLHGRRQATVHDVIAQARALGFGIEGGGGHPLCLVARDGSRMHLPGKMSKPIRRQTLATIYGFFESHSAPTED